ncbi:MAG: hypothetical protein EKK45_00205 [Curvibacter sp.]|jgi:hypothetical protein|nr:MAG: hypothetical protein EKK45_00205 [Curvibacter sp.]
MRKSIFVFCLTVGIGAGLLASWHDDWGLKIIMMTMGAMFGAPVAAGLSLLVGLFTSGSKINSTPEVDSDMDPLGERWRRDLNEFDREAVLASRLRSVAPDEHMFDPDKI